MIAQLGDFLRLTIENSEQQLVTLKEETEFLRCYLDIEQVRFGDRLTVAFELEPQTLSAQVPHLILQPVVENAIQHAIAPRAARGHINIQANRVNSLLRVAISDNGPGIPKEQLERIFERFTRGDAGLTQRVGGTGLGLAISKSLAEAHGGGIVAESTVGQGSTFRLRLPVAPPASPVGEIAPSDPGQGQATAEAG